MTTILIVCTANICRSPVAEALLRDRLIKQGFDDWRVLSAGTWADHGSPASRYGVEIMAEQGFELSEHGSQPVDEALLEQTDLVLCMASGHAESLRAEFPNFSTMIYLLTEMSGQAYSIHDPYSEPRPAYERMVAELTQLIDDGLPRIIELAQENEDSRLSGEEARE